MVTSCPPFALIPLARPETRLAVFPVPPPAGAVLMPFVVDDEFHVFARERRLPPCALSFLMLAGSWSARESRSGFVPNSMLADFSDDFAQAERTLCSAGILKRVKAGVRIVEDHGVTVVNAKDVTRDIKREQAEAEARRERERARKQRQRDREKAERAERMSADVTGMSREISVDVTPEKNGKRKKPQVNGNDVPRDIGVTSRGTEVPSRACARQDLDFDFDQSEGVSQSKSDARASDADDPELVKAVANALCAEAAFLPDDDQARSVIRVYEERARKAGTVIRDKPAYYAAAVAKEPDLWNGVLLPKAPLAAEPTSPLLPALAVRDPNDHEFDPPNRGAVCWCGSTENSPKHSQARRECPA